MTNIKVFCIKKPLDFLDDDDAYMNWFDESKSLEDSFKIGKKNFNKFIFNKQNKDIIGNSKNKTALEIGFGGGRLMNAACLKFKKVIGIDIHEAFDKTRKILESQGHKNFELIHFDNIDSIECQSIDFIYSFIVFQHFENWSVCERYFDMIDRIMKPDGLAMIYFGRCKNDNQELECIPEKSTESWWSSLRIGSKHLRNVLSERYHVLKIGTQKGSGQIFAKFQHLKE